MQAFQTHTCRLELGQWALTTVTNEQFNLTCTIRRVPDNIAYRVHTLRKRCAAASSIVPAVIWEEQPFAVVIQKVIGNTAYKRAFIFRQPDVRSGRKKCSYISPCREINDSPLQAVRRHLHILSRYEANFTHLFILLAVNSGFSPEEQVRIFYNSSTNLQPNLECCSQKYKTTHISTTLHPFQSHDMAAQRRQSSLWERISYVSVSVQTE